MAKIIFVTGGTRSGKSSYAMKCALEKTENPVYVATARHWDQDFEQRIQRHQADRDERWTSLEEEKQVSSLNLENQIVLIDCVTLWLTNFFVDTQYDVQKSLEDFKDEINRLREIKATFIIVSNELGMGTHAETDMGRKFTDLQGWANQYVAQEADQVIFMVSGIPMLIKNDSSSTNDDDKIV